MNKKFLTAACRVIHRKIVDNWFTVPLSLYPFEEDYQDYYYEIYDTISNYLMIDSKSAIEEIFMVFIYNYNEEGRYSNILEPPKDVMSDFEPQRIVISKYFHVIPYIVIKDDYGYYDLSVYEIPEIDIYKYGVGNQKQMNDSLRDYVVDRWADSDYDVISVYGSDHYLSFCYVTDTDKRIISYEESEYISEDMGDDDVIDFLNLRKTYNKSAKEFIEKYVSLGDTYNISEIIDEGIKIVKDILYSETYSALEDTEGLKEFLYDKGYIDKIHKYNEYNISNKQLSDLPKWLHFNWDEFLDDDAENTEYSQLSSVDRYDTFKYNNDIYYIIRIE